MSIIDSEDRPLLSDSADESIRPHDELADDDFDLSDRMDEVQATIQAQLLNDSLRTDTAANKPKTQRPARIFALGPRLRPDDVDRVPILADEIFYETRGRERFASFPKSEFFDAAAILVRYRIPSLEILRQTQKEAL